ncbi:MAG: protein kinase [Rhodospirillales bacterium]|nr:protein kinase [Rhodospirillales bacterium]
MAGEKLGKYEIRGILGKGAMGTVYDALDPVIDRRVAIKTATRPDPNDAEAMEEFTRFKREAQAAGRLAHPNIVGIFDYGETDSLAYIVMEFVDGRTLKAVLDANERLPPREIVRVMEGLLGGLAYSHERGVVHRDIKPANIMLTRDGTVKIADFGIARIESSSMTQAGTIMGTPAYMSPEQFMGQTVDLRTDIYSAGVVLYQMLTGERPFDGSMTAIMHKVLNTDPPRPSDLSVTAPHAFDAVVARAMARRPDARFPTAAAFAAALRQAMEGGDEPAPAAASAAGDVAEATLVMSGGAGIALGNAPVPPPAAAPAPPPVADPKPNKGGRALLLGGIAAVVVAAAAGGYFLLGTSTRAPAPKPVPASAPATAPAPQPSRVPAPAPGATPPSASVPQPAVPQPAVPQPAAPQPAPATAPTPAPAAVPAPASAPAPAPAPAAAPPLDTAALTRRIAAALGPVPCAMLDGSVASDGGVRVAGLLGEAQRSALRQALARAGASQATLGIDTFSGPYCPVLDAVHPAVPAFGTAPALGLSLAGASGRLLKDAHVVPQLRLPDYPSYLLVDYIANDGSLAHLQPSADAKMFDITSPDGTVQHVPVDAASAAAKVLPAGATVTIGDPAFCNCSASTIGWTVAPPYGTDMILAIASSAPLFTAPRPATDTLAAYLAALGPAIQAAEARGVHVSVRAILVRTAAQ